MYFNVPIELAYEPPETTCFRMCFAVEIVTARE